MCAFFDGYIAAALWSSTDNATEQGGEPLDKNYDASNIDPDTLTEMKAECDQFLAENVADISTRLEQAGHDFWLTRNRHGAGFWDGDWPEAAGKRLTADAHLYGECDLYVGDDGMIHV